MTQYTIDGTTKRFLECLFHELLTNGNHGWDSLYAWFLGEEETIRQAYLDLSRLEPEKD